MRVRSKEESNSITGAFGSLMAKGWGQVDKVTDLLLGLPQDEPAKTVGQGDKVTEKKKSIISGFPIPNTKDDILEFLSTAIPNAKQKGNFLTKQNPENKSHNDLAPTWLSKCEQIIMKAKFSMKEDKKTLEEIMQYGKELGIK